MLGRYAAADTAPPAVRARAMGSVLVATTVGAVLGPNLLAPADVLGRALGLPSLAGAFLVAVACFAAAAGLLLRRVPGVLTTAPKTDAAGSGRAVVPGLAVLAPTNLVMVAVMTMAPVHLHHTGLGLGPIGLVISVHILGMFAPSPLSGWLTDRVGPARAAAAAGVVLVAASVLAALGSAAPVVLGAALVLLGVGWNLGLIAGSTLLTAGVPDAERPRHEGWGEVAMGAAAAVGGALSGVVTGSAGYPVLAVGSAAVAALVVVTAWRAHATPADVAQRVA
jgi:predicted MFS family arabinose efflux permease